MSPNAGLYAALSKVLICFLWIFVQVQHLQTWAEELRQLEQLTAKQAVWWIVGDGDEFVDPVWSGVMWKIVNK